MSPKRLPPEMCDRIIDHLHHDVATLRACALACRSWLPTARYHLFCETRVDASRARSFDELISVSPHLGHAIASLELCSSDHRSTRWLREPSSFLTHLPAVSQLILSKVIVVRSFYVSLQTLGSTVTRLDMTQCIFEDHALFVEFLHAFPHLGDLCLEDPYFRMVDVPLGKHEPLGLRSLEMRSLGLNMIPPFLTWLLTNSSLESLAFYIEEVEDAVLLETMLQVLGPTLKHLRISVDSNTHLDRILGRTEFTLEPCTALKTCALSFHLREMCVPENQSLRWIPPLVAQLSSPDLQTISLSVFNDDMRDLRALDSECTVRTLTCARFDDLCILDWEMIERAVCQRPLGLRKLEICGTGDDSKLLSYIDDRCPELSERKVVTVKIHEFPMQAFS